MLLLPLSSPELVGRRLARTVYAEDGRPLLQAGVVLTQRYVEALRQRGCVGVYVEDPLNPDGPSPDAIDEVTRLEATSAAAAAYANLATGRPVDVSRVKAAVERILDALSANPEASMALSVLKGSDHQTFVHSVNVCVLSVALAVAAGLTRSAVVEMGVGALLHDIGKVALPAAILQKAGPLAPDERRLMESHTTLGYELLRRNPMVSLRSAHVAYQHHERWNGTGYPRGLSGEAIHRYARIVAIADVFDAMTSDRPYRPAPGPKVALSFLQEESGKGFDPWLVPLFVPRVAHYPNGTIVRLSTGDLAVVVRQVPGRPERPVVRVVADRHNEPVTPAYEVQTSEAVTIDGVLRDYPPAVLARL
ncbi:MAG: HD-GYP domain-containing protein, partial [Clostridia bacterium]|nr:HD-GYP domain-containing protein [Clostridia bacterium]